MAARRGSRKVAPRFRRVAGELGGAKLRAAWTDSPGELLGRLWATVGEPDPCDDGFTITIEDTKTGVRFTAYSGPSGPAFGGESRNVSVPARLAKSIDAFELLLRATKPVPCELVSTSFGDGLPEKIRIGWANGTGYVRIERKRAPRPTTTRDCERYALALAKRIQRTYNTALSPWDGWREAMQELVDVPDRFRWRQRTFENAVGVTIDAAGVPVIIVDERDGLEEIPMAEALPDAVTVKLWCSAFERWKRRRGSA